MHRRYVIANSARVRAPGETLIDIYNLTADDEQTDRDATVITLITDDKSFIIDSLTIQLNSLRKTPHRALHPSFEVWRDDKNRMQKMSRYQGRQSKQNEGTVIESYIQFVIDFTPANEHKLLRKALLNVMDDLEIVVADWTQMRDNTQALASKIEERAQASSWSEHGALLRWLADHNFAFLGYAEMTVAAGKTTVDEVLGVVRAAHQRAPKDALAILPPLPEVVDASQPSAHIVFTKSRRRSTIHRANYLDCILIDHETEPRRVSCILGFLAGASALLPTASIPHLRNKTAYLLRESSLRPGGHAYKALQTTLETLPREKLFQMDTRALYGLCMTILNHLERRKTRLHLHQNICGHFYSCLVYIPRDLFNSTLRERIQDFLRAKLNAREVTFNVYFSDSILTRIHYLVHCPDRAERGVDAAQLETEIQAMARDWNGNLYEAIRRLHGYERADETLALYRDAFAGGYQDEFSVKQAVTDIARLASVGDDKIHAVLSYNARHKNDGTVARFKVYSGAKSIALSDVLPILENMGIRVHEEQPHRFQRADGATFWLHDFEITRHDKNVFKRDEERAANFESTFIQAWRGAIENDGFNQLTLLTGLNWKEISLLRACYRYLKQIRLRYSEQYIIEALANQPALVVSIQQLFAARFDPALQDKTAPKRLRKIKIAITAQFDAIATLDEDRILRALLDVVEATLRTNYYQCDAAGKSKSYLSLKLSPRDIPHIPEPAPQYEIFVCSPRVEGVHLRGGAVARGGLRWSERAEDFRTEVLGLVKAQRVKNAVIVPVGSKGGFVAKQLPEGGAREEMQREVIACYQLFIRGMLDLTDNLIGTKVAPPDDVVRVDGDDPYLVVAADKGTATFSDIANDLACEYGFWLGDAFASGGSAGYDHKKMGITARGAWESVKRHFRERGKDIQSSDFTVVGIGDMAGDVFGNGMLLSRHIRLIAAFNHRHIFIDPNPDAAKSYRERERLFAQPRSSWDDYDRKVLSDGGAIFERSAKSVTLSPQAKKVLGAKSETYAPDELIRVILQADVELLWNGGIGTYIKSSTETDAAAQDKNNDALRVNAKQLRCKVIGEGGNLGVTQLGRIEFAHGGGLCYTDAIDNSAGVDTSDHEVNIKILLNDAIADKQLAPEKRNALLAKMQDEVGELVLQNNYAQTQVLSMEAARSEKLMPQQSRAIDALEAKGLLNREIEFLPDAAALEARREEGKWLTRPELAVLLSYAKMDLYQALLDSKVPDDSYLAIELARYFPAQLAKKYPAQIRAHRLGREIISTQITNQFIGVMGPNFHLRLADLTGASVAEITRAYIAARDILNAPKIHAEIEALDNRVAAAVQMEMLRRTAAAMRLCIAWVLRCHTAPLSIDAMVSAYQPGCEKLRAQLKKTLGHKAAAGTAKRVAKLVADGVPKTLAAQIAALPSLGYAVDIVNLATRKKSDLVHAASVYFQVREILGLDWVAQAIDSLPASNDWHERARFSLANDLRASHTAITDKVLSGERDKSVGGAKFEQWLITNRQPIRTIEKMTAALKSEPTPDFAMLSVLISELAWLH